MKITDTTASVRMLVIEAPGVDPIDVFIVNYAPGKGRITIRCWDRAWTAAWFAMGGETVERFFVGCGTDYIVSNMMCGLSGLRVVEAKREQVYLERIIAAVQVALAAEIKEPA
jgi:hypothetical protein